MFYVNEKIKKWLKVAGIIIAIFFLYAIYNLFFQSQIQNGLIGKNSVRRGEIAIKDSAPSVGRNLAGLGMPSDSDSKMLSEINEEGNNFTGDSNAAEKSADKKVIKNGNLILKVEKTEKAAEEIFRIAKEKGGEIFSTDFHEAIKGQKSGNLTVKVPALKFEETVSEIKKIATQVVSESTNAQDVTEQYSDLQAQLKNKRAEETSFLAILNQAGKINDVLAVTKEIARVRGEIERLEGKIRYMENQTDMATIFVNLSEDVEVSPVAGDWRPMQVAKRSAQELISNFQDFIDGIIYFVIVGIPSFIPFLVVLAVVYWIGKKIYQKIKKSL